MKGRISTIFTTSHSEYSEWRLLDVTTTAMIFITSHQSFWIFPTWHDIYQPDVTIATTNSYRSPPQLPGTRRLAWVWIRWTWWKELRREQRSSGWCLGKIRDIAVMVGHLAWLGIIWLWRCIWGSLADIYIYMHRFGCRQCWWRLIRAWWSMLKDDSLCLMTVHNH